MRWHRARSAPMGGRFARWNGQERAPNREPSQGSTDEVRTSLSRVRPRLMRAVEITTFGGPEVLDVVDLPDSAPGDGEQLD
jgi:hypothetical protein